ncbi:transcriptional regulator AsnC [Pleionea mediterranea]|jgi:Lrp/AsnC family transcriptional regulator for asnA, asnC and gidA|uniref:AsnC family transcriptional regulator n=1 Tax=Pleionea mediterranea TaxID=523701 RepID=A0A316FJH2_9GAMM|nr:transcriptional regulator AsnC [Pleionea mediterranea]PWK48649.1 AsnC family transcriptional regulator [Pleionea mediterranea]
MQNQTIDNLDKRIINALIADARTSYAELAKQFKVSPATIHVRIEKLKTAGIITGTHMAVDAKKLGYDVCCFIGINLQSAGDYPEVIAELEQINEVVEAYYTTGQYSVLIKIMTHSIEDLQWLLIDKIQAIDKVQATETLISLQTPIHKSIQL